MAVDVDELEQQVTTLLRRQQRILVATSGGDMLLDRSAYGLMCRLADDGPQRLGQLAAAFGLDPSTITRQVQALEKAGLAVRSVDATDRRASILDLTEEGHVVLHRARVSRRRWLRDGLDGWSQTELDELTRLLDKFNAALNGMIQHA